MTKENGITGNSGVTSGVETLISRLRDEGVNKGKDEASRIVAEAEKSAKEILERARKEAEQVRSEARKDAEALRKSGEDALKVAGRDAMLALKTELTERFASEVRHLLGRESRNPETLRQIILEVAGNVKVDSADAEKIEILLPRKIVGYEELLRNPSELEDKIITNFVKQISRDMLRDGVTFGVAKDNSGGLRLQLENEQVIIDLSDRAIGRSLARTFAASLQGHYWKESPIK